MKGRRILIVDDEPHVTRVLGMTLAREGYEIDTATNGMQALEKIRASAPDVMITDVQMPKMGGRALCETARERFPDWNALIMVMTSMTALEERSWIGKLKNIEFLEKPLSPRRLVSRLSAHFSGETALPEFDHE
jgi:DNA-binding response OmpR family regulator